MRFQLSVSLLFVSLAGCETIPPGQQSVQAPATASRGTFATVRYEGGDGSTIEKAVIIRAGDSQAGIGAEYAWLAQRYPGYKRITQVLRKAEGKTYDVHQIESPEGRRSLVFFDITAFYGRR